ncbi:thyroid adenoma-associated protein [Rhypophila decipiens]|uniref:Thyroid adenoma-associated protein n=1 Tax=Rhypophila decipiens TaxID=261697 RepID=A0AAN6Y5A4_9PEZI|nr:thyroid adenoma-associated protein [Rhypophila decipiens]
MPKTVHMEAQNANVPVDRANKRDLTGLSPEVFDNANTVTKWLMSQPQESRVDTAQALFEKLIYDASNSRQSHGNGHDCVKLCSFVQQCIKSPDLAVRQWAFTEPLSRRLFHFYLEWYEHDPHRALRLILDILVTACSAANPSPEDAKLLKDHILNTLVCIVARTSATQLTKSGLQCLDHFLSKQAITLDEIKDQYARIQTVPDDAGEYGAWRSFIHELFSWMELSYVSPLAGKVIVHVFRGLEKDSSPGFVAQLGQSWLQDGLERNPHLLDDIKNHVLVPIFKHDKPAALRLLSALNSQGSLSVVSHELTDQTLLFRLAALELGKKTGLVEEPSRESPDSEDQVADRVILQEAALSSFLAHPSLSVRASAFSLLVSSQATTKPFSQVAFDLLKKHLPAFHADYDAKLRNEVLGLSKSLIRRVKNVVTVSQRSLANFTSQEAQSTSKTATKRKLGPEAALKDEAEAKQILDSHEAFLAWYISFLKSELVPTASYQRHITALKAALLTLKIGKHAGATGEYFDVEIAQVISTDYTWIRLLLDLLMDPFDDVREGSSTLLSLFPSEIVNSPTNSPHYSATLLEILREFCPRAQALADRTGRADHGDGAARSQGLLCGWLNDQERQIGLVSTILDGLEAKISKAENDLGHAVVEKPVHPDFAALSYAWPVLAKSTYSDSEIEAINKIHTRILGCSQRIWSAVEHVLCDDSPEGHLPEEMEEIDGLDTKDLLSYSFRAVHESSNLLRLMVGTLGQTPANDAPGRVPYPPLDVFKRAGNLTFEQLSKLRHRGAFSTVSLTFTTCCQLTQKLQNIYPDATGSDNLLRDWYQGTLDCIMTQASTTRRSAGIPSLIAAVLAAGAQSPSFSDVFHTLEDIAKKEVTMAETDGSNLPQVHALNSLREIFRSSLLSKKAEGFLATTLQLAATSLKSEVWAIRNCGLLLLRSLIDSLLGTGESKSVIESGWDGVSIRISYNKYPTLPGVILGLLKSADSSILTETGGINSNSAAAEAVFPALDIIRRAGPPEENREELWGRITAYLGSRIWHVREIAARTLCSFLLRGNWLTSVARLLRGAEEDVNRLHGVLLTVRFVLERKVQLGEGVDGFEVEQFLTAEVSVLPAFKACPIVQAAYLEIFNLLPNSGSGDVFPLEDVLPSTDQEHEPHLALAKSLLRTEEGIKLVKDTAGTRALIGPGRASSNDFAKMGKYLLDILSTDTNTACKMLEVMPKAWDKVQRTRMEAVDLVDDITPQLVGLYAEVVHRHAAPEVRAQALLNLGSLVDKILLVTHRTVGESLPSAEELDRLWTSLQRQGEIINPTLACAIIKASGSLMAAAVRLTTSEGDDKTTSQTLERRLRNWGVLIADSLDVENTFDTRHAATEALKSFFLGSSSHQQESANKTWSSKYLPIFSALYDSLLDDDDEVREVASSAASALTGQYFVAPEAANNLVTLLSQRFSHHDNKEFARYVLCRLVGQPGHLLSLTTSLSTAKIELTPAKSLLQKALDFDDSLFAAEEQNLFIDEVRETMRWRERAFSSALAATASGNELVEWTEQGLEYIISLAEKEKDGPLGWTSDQHVFAVCARVVLCAGGIFKSFGTTDAGRREVGELLEKFRVVGERMRVHGSLLEMARL